MEWNMLKESKKLFPHWLDKSNDSNFSKHLTILNNQQSDIRHKLRCLDWSKLIDKPLQIHKSQSEPYKWKLEFLVDIPRLKKVNIYKNPTIVNNKVLNITEAVNGYFDNGVFYKEYRKEIVEDPITHTVSVVDEYSGIITGVDGQLYYDLGTKKYYEFDKGYFELGVDDVENSLIYTESFIDNYSHFFRHICYDSNNSDYDQVIINKFCVDDDGEQVYKTRLDYSDGVNPEDNGKFELSFKNKFGMDLCYNITTGKYCIIEDDEVVELDDDKIIYSTGAPDINLLNPDFYYVFVEKGSNNSEDLELVKIPLFEEMDLTPIISDDRYVLEVFTWDDYHFMKGFPEIDYIDSNHNNMINVDERDYDNLRVYVEEINDVSYLVFRVHQKNIKLVEVLKDGKPVHVADFVIESPQFDSNGVINNNFAHIYNYNDNLIYFLNKNSDNVEEVDFDVDEYVWRLRLSDDDKVFNLDGDFELKNIYDLKVTYYDSLHPLDSVYDKCITKRYVGEDNIFYHDMSLDMIGTLYNVPRYVYTTPSFNTEKEKLDYYNRTYPSFCNSVTEDDYHYQERLKYYINNYNKIYFPELELWKYYHIDSELVNRMVVISEQNYSYLRDLNNNEDQYINELSTNKLESSYMDYDREFEVDVNLTKPKKKSVITAYELNNSHNGILVDSTTGEYIYDIYNNPVRIDYAYTVDSDGNYSLEYEDTSRKFEWYVSSIFNDVKGYYKDGKFYSDEACVNLIELSDKYDKLTFLDLFTNKSYKYVDNKFKEISNIYELKLTDNLNVVPNTRYQLRFCVKKYPDDLKLRIIYKNRRNEIREVREIVLNREDYSGDDYNEIVYTNYNTEWGIVCEYLCNNFVTLDSAQNIELVLESSEKFSMSDVTLQRVRVNHFDTEYMRTSTDYNSCVYDLYADYTQIPSNLRYDNLNSFNKLLNRSLPLTKLGYFNFVLKNHDLTQNISINGVGNVYPGNLLQYESGVLNEEDHKELDVINSETNMYEYTYSFIKYVHEGDYEINMGVFDLYDVVVPEFKVDVEMIVFNENNEPVEETITLPPDNDNNMLKYLVKENNKRYFKIPFHNKSNNSMNIRIYTDNPFKFNNFDLQRLTPLTIEEITK